MDDVVVGLLAIAVGALLCLRGYLAMRLVIPVWGAFSGFFFGAGLAAGLTDKEVLGTALGWLLGLAFALVFGALAYLYFQVAVILGMGAIGFSIGAGLMVTLGIEWSWFIVLVGLVVGVAFGALALGANVPMFLLVGVSAVAGAFIVVLGAMLLFNVLDLEQLNSGRTTETIDDDAFWYVIYLGVVVASVVVQLQSMTTFEGGLRDAWDNAETPVTPKTMGPPGSGAV
jgi:hypothetical protein